MDQQTTIALYGLGGVVVGALISSGFAYAMESRKIRMEIAANVLEKRITAHESMLTLVSDMTLMHLVDGTKFAEDPERYPLIFHTIDGFNDFYTRWTLTGKTSLHWMRKASVNEVNLFADYLLNVSYYVNNSSDETLRRLGVILRQDVIDFADSLGRHIRDFFQDELYEAKPARFGEWSKYKRSVTIARLENTNLFKERDRINSMYSGHAPSG